jgi:hypothetical protein
MMKKFKLYYDKDKEEAFLNDMSAKGYAMKRFFLGMYTFEKCQPNEYTYRVDLISDKTVEQRNELYDLIRDSGGELVQTWGIWAIFRKKGNFELYTDPESQIKQFRRIRTIFLRLALMEFILSLPNWYNAIQTKEPTRIFLSLLLTLIAFIFLKQVRTCTKKITELEKLA